MFVGHDCKNWATCRVDTWTCEVCGRQLEPTLELANGEPQDLIHPDGIVITADVITTGTIKGYTFK